MIYKTLPIAPHYNVSECGTSIINTLTNHSVTLRKQRKADKTPTGYIYATILHGEGFYLKQISVHRLVAMSFHGMPPEGKPWVNHKDGDKANNHASNLEWTSISDNIKHKFDTGLYKTPTGEDHWKYGTHHTKETKQLMSDAKKGVKHPKFTGYYVIDGVRFPSAIKAAEVLNIPHHTVLRRCKNKPNKFSNFFFEPISGIKMK